MGYSRLYRFTANRVVAVRASLSAVVLTAFALMLCVAQSVGARPLDEVLAAKALRVVVYRDNPPFSYLDGDDIRGIDVDLGRAIARELGVAAEIIARMVAEDVDDDLRFNVWKGPYSEGGVGDVMMHVPVDRELMARNPLAVISNAYFQERIALAIDKATLGAPESFTVFMQHKIGVQYSTVADYFLLRYDGGKLVNNISHYTKLEKGVAEFIKGDTAAMLGVQSALEGMFHTMGAKADFIELPMPGLVRKHWLVGTAVKDNSRDLGYAIGGAFERLKASGELDRIFATHGVTYIAPE